MISLIAAHDRNNLIGSKGSMPWGNSLKADLNWFKQNTLNKIVVMGRKTFESIGKPLHNRINVILTTDESKTEYYENRVCYSYNSVEEVLSQWDHPDGETVIIGGAQIYTQFLHFADRLYITHIDHEFEGDTYFPEYNLNDYNTVYEYKIAKGDDSPYDLTFNIYERK